MDRRQKAENDYRQKFEELGLSDRFNFIGRDWTSDHGRKVFIKCKTCNAEFLTYSLAMIFKGRQDHLLCPECGAASDGKDVFARSETAKVAASLYAQGLEQMEIAERLGCTVSDVGNAAKSFKVVDPDRKYSGSRKANANRSLAAGQALAEHLSEIGFEYVGGYTSKTGKMQIRCQKCGAEFKRTVGFLRDGNVICVECQKADTRRKNEEQRRAAAQEAETRKIEREWYRLAHPPKEAYEEQHEAFLNRSGICEICGKPYTVREYVESCGIKYARDNGVCSSECKKEKAKRIARISHKDRRDSHRHRARKYGLAFDSSITLKKLVERDGLKCAICGEMCDWNDHSWSKYSGPMYPSIDHIVPMAKGGPHTWENVQVAHIICNSEKGDKVEGVV